MLNFCNANDRKAEAAVVGAMMFESTLIPAACDLVKAEYFYHDDIKEIFVAVCDVYQANNGHFDLILLNAHCKVSGRDLIPFAKEVLDSTPGAANMEYYASIVSRHNCERNMIIAVDNMAKSVMDTTKTVEDKQQLLQQAVIEAGLSEKQQGAEKIGDILSGIYLKDEIHCAGIKTGFYDLDAMINSVEPANTVVVAARPSMGKSAFALNIALNMAKNGIPVVFFSLEMSKPSLGIRIFSSESGIPLETMRGGYMTKEDYIVMAKTVNEIADMPLYIDNACTLTPADLAMRIMRYKIQYKIQCVFIDYLQLIYFPQGRRTENRQQEITKISADIKAIAKKTEIPIFIVSQLNRGVETRSDKKPLMSDLRESGSIEQDADIVLLLHRQDYYDKTNTGEATCIVAKNRQGRTGEVPLVWIDRYVKFESRAKV